MKPATRQFKSAAAATLASPQLQSNLRTLYTGFHQARIEAGSATPDWERMRDRAREIKTHTINNLDSYLGTLADNVERKGGKIFFAADAEAANRYVIDLARARDVRTVIKGKSMVSEEMGLNQRLEDASIQPVETDLGEYIIQLADETPFHIIAPAMHKSRDEVAGLFHEKLGTPRTQSIDELTMVARRQLRGDFARADMGITGGNFLAADTGTLAVVSNEGNGRMCTSMPRIHVAIVGMEKMIPSMADLGLFLRLLIRSATGQRISSYVTLINGPRHHDEEDGPEEFHLVIMDNGRSKLLADPQLREALNCLRCGACLNACPVYRKVGGHAYGWVYAGPIGAVVSPVMTNIADAKDLPFASSLCGACQEACPVRINIPRMLLHLRRQISEGADYPDQRSAGLVERLAMKAWRISVSTPLTMRLSAIAGRLAQWPWARKGRVRWLPPPLSGWTRHRYFPTIASKPFRNRWRE